MVVAAAAVILQLERTAKWMETALAAMEEVAETTAPHSALVLGPAAGLPAEEAVQALLLMAEAPVGREEEELAVAAVAASDIMAKPAQATLEEVVVELIVMVLAELVARAAQELL
jgi:hypothetical protein